MSNENNKIMYKDLSYKLQGLFFDIRNDLGSGHKESIYQKALEKELIRAGIKFIKEPPIKIYSKNDEFLGLYRPDFLIEDKIIIELKAVEYVSRQETARVYDYLRNSKYELAYFVNFASLRLFVKRLIFTNDRKTQMATNSSPRMATNLKRIATNLILFVAISTLFVAIRGVNAAEIYFETHTKEAGVNQYVEVGVFLNAEEEPINAVEGSISFPSPFLVPREIRNGSSVITFWIEQPFLEQDGKLRFSGVIPGGYTGSNGYLFSVIFQTQNEGEATLDVINGRALLNDGSGSEVSFRSSPTRFKIGLGLQGSEVLPLYDPDAPESFVPQVVQDPSLFDGEWFLVFATQDKGSGIAGYAVHESRRMKTRIATNDWQEAESPHVLKDQNLRSFIYIKAVDRAGNERIASVEPRYPMRWYEQPLIWGILIISAVIIYFVGRILWPKKSRE